MWSSPRPLHHPPPRQLPSTISDGVPEDGCMVCRVGARRPCGWLGPEPRLDGWRHALLHLPLARPLAGPCGCKGQREPDARTLAVALGGDGGKYREARLENLGEMAATGSPRVVQASWD
jgi:hypothetical protein